MLLLGCIHPLPKGGWAWPDFFQDGMVQCRLESLLELVYSSLVICCPFFFDPQVLEFCNEVLQFISLHFHSEELLMSIHFLVSVGKCTPEVPFKDLSQDLIVQSKGTIS